MHSPFRASGKEITELLRLREELRLIDTAIRALEALERGQRGREGSASRRSLKRTVFGESVKIPQILTPRREVRFP
jgi:hypothetical protein